MLSNFTNTEVDIDQLPKYETVNFHPISLKKRQKALVVTSFFLVLWFVSIVIYYYYNSFEIISELVVGLILILFCLSYIEISLRQKSYGYALREHDILFRRGFIYQKTTVIPFNRIQNAAIFRSFLDRYFGISSLKIYTAGGAGSDISIPGLLPETAQKLKDTLSKKLTKNEQ